MAELDRRHLLAAPFALAVAGCGSTANNSPAPIPQPVPTEGLHALASQKGVAFGFAMGTGQFNDPRVREIAKLECGLIVCENEHKWPATEPAEGRFDFRAGDAIVAFAEQNRMAMRGHTLFWASPRWLPRWVTNYDLGSAPASKAASLITTHVQTVARHYGDRIPTWDAVNEAIDNDTGQLRDTVLSKPLGVQCVDIAFRAAREALPKAKLVYNDFMSWDAGRTAAAHRDGVLRLLEGMKARNVPVDALGIQGHIGGGGQPGSGGFGALDESAWRRFLDEARGMGLTFQITELDVQDRGLPAEVTTRDREVAAHTKAFLDMMLSYKEVDQVLTWGLVDHQSWVQSFFPRADGLPVRPLPYDANFQPKPMREAIAAAFRAAPAR